MLIELIRQSTLLGNVLGIGISVRNKPLQPLLLQPKSPIRLQKPLIKSIIHTTIRNTVTGILLSSTSFSKTLPSYPPLSTKFTLSSAASSINTPSSASSFRT